MSSIMRSSECSHLKRIPSNCLQECKEMLNIGTSIKGLPEDVEMVEGPRVQRQVRLQDQFTLDIIIVWFYL